MLYQLSYEATHSNDYNNYDDDDGEEEEQEEEEEEEEEDDDDDDDDDDDNINIFNQGKPVSRSCYQGVPWTTKHRIKITIKSPKNITK